ncbi:hypothetical protein JNW90_34195 [Micromonospora sp. STR1s_5]|nr:hypothetical protein [Micromonospora sp. STR1s_5]
MPEEPFQHTAGLRETLRLANSENARLVASQLGSRIAQISSATQDDPPVREMLVRVRKTSIDLLEALSRRRNEEAVRQDAFAALDELETELARLNELGRALHGGRAGALGPALRR